MNTLIDTLGPYATWIIAGIIILLAVGLGWRDIIRLSWTRIWAISTVCFSESIRRRVLLITPIAILGVMIVSQLQRPFDEQDAIRQTTKFALFTTGLVVVVVGILLASTSLPKEIENRVIFTVVTKPTTRLEIVLGKTLGFARVSATILLIMGIFTAGYLQFRAWNFNREITKRLESGAVDAISRPTLEHYKTNGLLSAKSYTGTSDLQFYTKLPANKEVRRYANATGDNQIIVPFELKPEMFGNPEQGFRMAMVLTVGYEKSPNAPAAQDPATTQPADFGPTPLLSSTRPAAPPPAAEPAIAVGFLDHEETYLVPNTEIRGGEPIKLPSADGSKRVLVELSPDNISKLAKAAGSPQTNLVYIAIIGASDAYHYFVDERPAFLITGQVQADGTLRESGQPIEPAIDERTEKPSLPIFRGGYSRYGQQLKGEKQNGMVAVYHFTKADNLDTDTANFEMRLGIDRGGTEGAEEEDTVTQVSMQIRNTTTGQLGKEQIIKPETNRTAYFSFPKDELAGGEFDLIIRCATPDHTIGLRAGGLALVTDTGSFYGNLFKSLLIFWLLSVLVVAVAICCSTFLSWPIAVVLCIVILLGKWGVMQLGDATKPGIGAQVANDFGFKDSAQAKVVDKSVETLAKFLNALAAVLPDISQYSATEDIERGVSIPWFKLRESLTESLAFGIPLLLLGYVVLKNKEVAPVSQTVESARTTAAEAEMPNRSRSRGLIVVVMIVAFIASVLLRDLARDRRQAATTARNPAQSSGTTLASMNSFTLGLMLGGLRGPLVMMLWTSSETQKQDKNLEDFDTKVELIRLLQPEFDSVLLFQIWNKAYNISVQMSSLYNKYITILDAIDYGKDALADRPDNINVISAVADIYFNKLGNSAEKHYYRAQVRKESLPHKNKARDDKKDPGWRRTQLDQIVDANGIIDPKLVTPLRQRPANVEAGQPFNDGSELQYLKKFEPYPYGVSPVAIGYNYFMQAQTLQRVTHARHAQTSEMVVDSRPAIALKFWVEEEQELGRRHELAAFGKPLPTNAGVERIELELPMAVLPLDQKPANPAKLDEAIYNYERSASLVDEGVNEYREHLKHHPTGLEMYRSHIDGLNAIKRFSLADAAYLKALRATGEERAKWKKIAKDEYEQTIITYVRIMLRFYTDEPFFRAALPNVSREQIDNLTLEQLMGATQSINRMIERGAPESHIEDRKEYSTYIGRCIERLKELEK